MQNVPNSLTHGSIMDSLGLMDSEGYKKLREKIASMNDVTFENIVLSLDRTIGLIN
ncbi:MULTISPECIES: hypothetical protein [Paenibacillus]|uniref:hypothetical protein n=1 Tax=Paenibacillus TaxID=44249 RepID=UPI0015C3A0F6|nr:hypothetical protein [Paenibacillus odorifer]